MMKSYLTAEISASAIRHNLSLLRSCLPARTKMCAVVKSDCYGHGFRTALTVIEPNVDCLAVATVDEALLVRQLIPAKPVLAFFSPCAHSNHEELVEALCELISNSIMMTVVDPGEAGAVGEAARRVGKEALVHIKVDTGMTRSGVQPQLAPDLAAAIRRQKGVRLAGMYTHLATADEADKAFALSQLEVFGDVAKAANVTPDVILHAANSAGIIDLPSSHLDMVRAGIAMYGYQPSDEMHIRLPLKPILRVTGRLMQLRTVLPGARAGYGLTYQFDRPSMIGLVPIGYADGYFRSLSNRAVMRLHGQLVPVRGRVSMDQVILDVTDCPQARIGDEVEIFSKVSTDPHSVENLARLIGTIPYELTCRLGRRVQRVLVD